MSHARSLISKWLGLLLVAAAPFYLFPAPNRWSGLLILPVTAGLAWLVTRKPLPVTALNPALLLLSIMALISTWVSYDLTLSLPKVAGLVFGLAVFFAAVWYGRTRTGWTVVLIVLVLSGLAVALVGLAGINWELMAKTIKFPIFSSIIEQMPYQLKNLLGTVQDINPNEVAGSLLWVLPPLLGLFISLTNRYTYIWFGGTNYKIRKIGKVIALFVAGIALSIMFIVFVLAQSRTGYIALVITFMLMALLMVPKKFRPVANGLAVMLVISFTILVISNFSTISGLLYGDEQFSSELSNLSLASRIKIWNWAITMIQSFPVTGMGMNIFRYAVFFILAVPCNTSICDIAHAHNELLQVALDLGLPGLLAFFAIYMIAFRMLVRLYQRADDGFGDNAKMGFPLKIIVLGLGGGLFSHFVFGLTDAVTLGAKPGFLFWLLLGLICGISDQYSRHSTRII